MIKNRNDEKWPPETETFWQLSYVGELYKRYILVFWQWNMFCVKVHDQHTAP